MDRLDIRKDSEECIANKAPRRRCNASSVNRQIIAETSRHCRVSENRSEGLPLTLEENPVQQRDSGPGADLGQTDFGIPVTTRLD